MKNNNYDYSLNKLILLVTAFVLNVALITLLSVFGLYYVYFIVCGVSLFVYVPLVGLNQNIYHKALWISLLTFLPVFGTTIYILLKAKSRYINKRKRYQALIYRSQDLIDNDETALEVLKDNQSGKVIKYLHNFLDAPIYQNNAVKYLNSGEKYFNELLAEINSAKKYILIEMYYIQEGNTWNAIFEALKQKARDGVEIKLLYDRLACKNAFIDKLTFKKLANYKIDALAFNNGLLGFGNHRKAIVIDGIVGFVGGANISDRYIQTSGEWMQSGVKITGDAVWNITTMILNDYIYSGGNISDIINYKPDKMPKIKVGEFVQPFCTYPLSNRNELKSVFVNLIRSATKELTIISSHINIDGAVYLALKDAVLGGVKVNVIVSSSYDTPSAYAVSRSNILELIKVGVNVYEYGGFVRQKAVLIDDNMLVMGSFNLICDPINALFENGVVVTSNTVLKDANKNINSIMTKCALLTLQDAKVKKLSIKLKGFFKKILK